MMMVVDEVGLEKKREVEIRTDNVERARALYPTDYLISYHPDPTHFSS